MLCSQGRLGHESSCTASHPRTLGTLSITVPSRKCTRTRAPLPYACFHLVRSEPARPCSDSDSLCQLHGRNSLWFVTAAIRDGTSMLFKNPLDLGHSYSWWHSFSTMIQLLRRARASNCKTVQNFGLGFRGTASRLSCSQVCRVSPVINESLTGRQQSSPHCSPSTFMQDPSLQKEKKR